MNNKGTRNSQQDASKTGRDDRLAAALRENLKKRKDLARKRTHPGDVCGHAGDTPLSDCDGEDEAS